VASPPEEKRRRPQVQLPAAIAAARTTTVLDALAKAVWSALDGGHLPETAAQEASEAIEGRRRDLRRPPYEKAASEPRSGVSQHVATKGPGQPSQTLFRRLKTQRTPDRAAALARRRHVAGSGPMPPALAAQFTTGELAVLRIVADEVREKGRCDRTYGELAARAGVCRRTAMNALKRAARLGLLHIEVRPRPGRKNLTNVVTILSREWKGWIERGGQGGRAKHDSSKSHVFLSAMRGVQKFSPYGPLESPPAARPCHGR
jgi:hypothetical protein